MSGPEDRRERLRPGVAATLLRDGLHPRARGTAVTLEGSRALPRLWPVLAARLGGDREAAAATAGPPELEAALATVTARLREHDLLVDHPAGAELPPWPGAVAADPAAAVSALAAARPVVTAADPAARSARAVLDALARGGAAPAVHPDPALPPGLVIASVAQPPRAVAVHFGAGFVTAPTGPDRVRADAEQLAARLGPADEPSELLATLLAAAAAQRLLCAVADLPDPADTVPDPRLPPGRPAVLIAEDRPPRAEYHPWAAGPGPAAAAPAELAEALHRIAALADRRLGVLDAPSPGGLPQLPVPTVSCPTPAGALLAVAPRTDLARLAAACRSAELHLAAEGAPAGAVVGAGFGHALGRALRRAAAAGRWEPAGPPPPDQLDHPQAAHWLAVLARGLGRAPVVTVRRLSGGGAWTAEVEGCRAIEAGAADALALAALDALGHRTEAARHTVLTGAAAPLAAAGRRPAAWADAGHTDRWLTELAYREPQLQTTLQAATGLRAVPRSGRTALATALAGCGFTVLVPEGAR
ncbi:hypothetical protein [Streptomyces sp. TLI_171]|uniref:hypothetical protein n=1 Tax=Streptomyces sp. TLI_171 TaxID=1938859 RepID=UPI000C1839B3|nr:hypothetical protein [Streptomyces sp. TLI_171]RKE17124.1 hypothetical protein BX266_0375 [Streptomyces sp. TLI_171]